MTHSSWGQRVVYNALTHVSYSAAAARPSSYRAMSTHAHDTEMCDDHPHTEPEPAVAFVPFLEPRSPPPLKPLKLHPAPSPDDPNNNSSGSSSAQTSPPDPPRFAARVSQGSAFELCTQPETTPTAAAAMRGSGRPPLPVAPHVSPSCSPERNCRRCAELAAECAAKDQSIRALTQRLTRTAKLLEAIQDLAEQQATHEQHSDFEMTSLEEKVARYRLALAGVVVDPASFEGHPRRRHRRARRPPGYANRSAHRRPGGLEQVHELGT